MADSGKGNPSYSLPSILAIIAAIISFTTGAGWGLILAIVAIVLGVIGVLLALMPSIRGGIISFISVAAGVIGIIVAILKFVF